MQQVVTVNDDFRHLNDGLPPHIARFIVAGEYDRALRLIEEELEAGNRPEMEPCLRAEYARLLRTRRDFCLTRADVIGQIRAEWPEFGDAELDTLIDHERLDWRYVDGEQRFLQSCVESLRLYPNDVPGLACPPTDRADQLAVLDEMRSKGYAERRVRVRHTLSVGKDVDVDPETHVMAWIPYPSGQQVANIKLVEASEGAQIAPATAPQRTVHWDVQGERSFFVEYEYTIRAPYVDLWADNPIAPVWDAPFSPAPAPTLEDLAAEEPHWCSLRIFVRSLSASMQIFRLRICSSAPARRIYGLRRMSITVISRLTCCWIALQICVRVLAVRIAACLPARLSRCVA